MKDLELHSTWLEVVKNITFRKKRDLEEDKHNEEEDNLFNRIKISKLYSKKIDWRILL